jgi:hypothetical protein
MASTMRASSLRSMTFSSRLYLPAARDSLRSFSPVTGSFPAADLSSRFSVALSTR